MRETNLRRILATAFAAMAIAGCAAQTPHRTTARVCDPHLDATCKPTPGAKVVVK